MRLPTGSLHELLERRALRVSEHGEHVSGFGAPARNPCCRLRLSLRLFGGRRLLGLWPLSGGRGLLGRRGLIRRNVRGLCADTAP